MAVHSRLRRIIARLEAMVVDGHGEVQHRTFEQNGIAVCDVSYDQLTGLFVIHRLVPDTTRAFDQIDLAAIEVYECLTDFRQQF